MRFTYSIKTMASSFTIADSHGQDCYQVSTVPDVAERLALRQAGGGQLAVIVRDAVSHGFEVLIAGERAALVQLRGLINVQCLVDTPGGSLGVPGDVLHGSYALSTSADIGADPQPQVQVQRQPATPPYGMKYQVGVDLADGEDPARFIATVLAIEHLCEDRRCNSGELQTGLRVLRQLVGVFGR